MRHTKTIREIVDDVYAVVTGNEGMSLFPSDVGHIVSLFLEGMIHSDPNPENKLINDVLQAIADECESVTDK